jgi:hypothetical protein
MLNPTTLTATAPDYPAGTVIKRFMRRCDSRYRGRTRRGWRKYDYGTFYRAAIVVRLDDGRIVQGYITDAYPTTDEVRSRANTAPNIGERIRITCTIAQSTFMKPFGEVSKTWFPVYGSRGFLRFTR